MSALAWLREQGITARIEAGSLRIECPRAQLTEETVTAVRSHRPELVRELLGDDRFEQWCERAAILEFDAGMSRDTAERQSLLTLGWSSG